MREQAAPAVAGNNVVKQAGLVQITICDMSLCLLFPALSLGLVSS